MPAAAWVTLIIAALIIGLTAVALLRVIMHLNYVRKRLAVIHAGAESIAERTETVPGVLTSMNANLKPVRDFCEGV